MCKHTRFVVLFVFLTYIINMHGDGVLFAEVIYRTESEQECKYCLGIPCICLGLDKLFQHNFKNKVDVGIMRQGVLGTLPQILMYCTQ